MRLCDELTTGPTPLQWLYLSWQKTCIASSYVTVEAELAISASELVFDLQEVFGHRKIECDTRETAIGRILEDSATSLQIFLSPGKTQL